MALVRRSRGDLDWPGSMFGRWFGDWPESWRDLFDLDQAGLRVEEYEEEGNLVVRAEMPGLDPDKDVEITVEGDTLRIKAERRQSSEMQTRRGYRSEFRYGSFFRTVPLPAGARGEDVAATYHDGILEVRVPIDTEQATAKRIPIKRG
jgi:HSP20 family protein